MEDCATQRNFDAAGRAQAAALGERLAQAGEGRRLFEPAVPLPRYGALLALGTTEARQR